ncbi:ABC transporter permease [Metabacillus halosaccharovorans]|uniref:ABC transporter permease n=1 Tax=Metabacillus halosaccharovorans TaxID=930124 RepID=UPI002040B9D3|nr:ABC transporter permease [Metabacillus halosaccharovorans]MCM3443131.1 ABC transporter permease [Metabacillus halosaccharovorans]
MSATHVESQKVNQVSIRKAKKRVNTAVTQNLIRILLVVCALVFWQIGVNFTWIDPFLMGSPLGILEEYTRLIQSGELFTDMFATVFATIIGFLIGSLLGSAIGLLLWYSKFLAKILDPFVVALNGLPKIALAPMIIIWFGSGIFSKIALAIIATLIVALLSAYQGTHQIDSNLVNLMKSLGARKSQIFRKVVIPSTLPWIISAFRLNIGFALVAVIGGEFISSDKGLGRMIFVAGNLFNLNVVWVGVITLMIVAITLYFIVSKLEMRLLPWENANKEN